MNEMFVEVASCFHCRFPLDSFDVQKDYCPWCGYSAEDRTG